MTIDGLVSSVGTRMFQLTVETRNNMPLQHVMSNKQLRMLFRHSCPSVHNEHQFLVNRFSASDIFINYKDS
jgi:hypothetical protein